MLDIEFHDREREIREITDIMKRTPNLITFIYGPINSGKTELINHVIKHLGDEYQVFYINLRTKFLRGYEEFIESLFEFELEGERKRETMKELVSSLSKAAGIPITDEFMSYVFKDKKPKNAFSYIIKVFEEVRKRGKIPVLIVDELQKIGDIKIDDYLIYELFNFFIDLTKELHIAHVFGISSDSLFIEKIYSDAMLQGRCRYLLIDDFEFRETMQFLDNYGLEDKEKEIVLDYAGGKPVYLIELVNAEDREKKVEELYETRKWQVRQRVELLKIVKKRILFEEEAREITYEAVMKILEEFKEGTSYEYRVIVPELTYLVKENILFVDACKGMAKPQSSLDLLAIRDVIEFS